MSFPTTGHTNDKSVPSYVPSDSLSQAAYHVAHTQLDATILTHSLRTFVYAAAISEKEKLYWHEGDRRPLLFVAAIFHDIGTTDSCNGPQRFEVEGADAAVAFLKDHGISQADTKDVWIAIACHTCSGIAERITPLARAIRLGVLVDFKRADLRTLLGVHLVEKVERALPRGEPEKVLGDAVVRQALEQPSKAPAATWPGVLTRFQREHPEHEGVNKEF